MGSLGKLSRSINGRVAVVTGAASGMGRATAHLFSDEGASVAVCDRNSEGVSEVVKEITDAGGVASGYVIDLDDAAVIGDFISQVRDDLGPIDILVNNAGVSHRGNIESENFEDLWAMTFSINLDAQMRLIRSCLSDLKRNEDGRIVNIASTEGLGEGAPLPPDKRIIHQKPDAPHILRGSMALPETAHQNTGNHCKRNLFFKGT